jgi:hypothetical protein
MRKLIKSLFVAPALIAIAGGVLFARIANANDRLQVPEYVPVPVQEFLQNPRTFLLDHPDILSLQLRTLLGNRCFEYVSIQRKLECAGAVDRFLKNLEIQPIILTSPYGEKVHNVVTLTRELKELSADPVALAFLNDLNSQLTQLRISINRHEFSPQDIEAVDIGYVGAQYFGSIAKTLRALAALFQDIPPSQTQVNFLFQSGERSNDRTRLVFAAVLRKVVHDFTLIGVKNGPFPLKLFGQRFYDGKVYHALVPAYAASQLKSQGFSQETSFTIPFLFNYLYVASKIGGSVQTFFVEPSRILEGQKQNDILAGEVGSLMGIGLAGKISDTATSRSNLTYRPAEYLRSSIKMAIPVRAAF